MRQTFENTQLAERIYEEFPVTQPAFGKLLGLLDIKSSREIPTACVTIGARSAMLINPDFVKEKCLTSFDLTLLVLHELYHVVLGHTRLYQRSTPIHNWAFDAVINAQLSQLFPSPSQTALFRRLYKHDVFPECLLRPPEGWNTNKVHWHLTGIAGDVHKALYAETSTSYESIFDLLTSLDVVDGDLSKLNTDSLLGNHAEEDETCDSVLLQEIRNIIAEWPMTEIRSGRDQGQQLEQQQLILRRRHHSAVSILRKALARLADIGINGSLSTQAGLNDVDTLLPYRSLIDRRAEVFSGAGFEPFFFKANSTLSSLTVSERVHIYLDVSGSMDGVIKALYEALIPLLDKIAPKIHLFSSAISDIDHAKLRKGFLNTTGGTSIDVVTDHILKTHVKKALIITDGWVGKISSSHVEKLNKGKIKIHGAITYSGEANFLRPVKGKAWKLPEIVNA